MTEQEIRELLLVVLEYSYEHDDWSHPLDDALAGVTAEQASWRPGGDAMGIWDIVLHLAVWNENIIERIKTGEKVRPKEGAWPPRPDVARESDWDSAKSRLRASLDLLRSFIESVPLEKVHASPYGIGDLATRPLHMAYHIGQIVKIRECQGW
jgi:hypothetical protein